MAAYVHGNLAAQEPKRREERVSFKETRRVVVRAKTLSLQEKLLYLFTVAICVLVAGVIIWRYAEIYEMNAQIHEIQAKVRDLQAENSLLKEKVDRLNDPDKLRQEANKMGLVQRDDAQTIRISDKSAVQTKDGDGKIALKP